MTDNSQSDEADGDERLFSAPSGTLTEVQYNPTSDQELTAVIVEAITDQTGIETETYHESPLHDYIDVDAIETLLFGTQPDQSTGPATQNITFRYRNILVTVRADGVVQLSGAGSSTRTN
ncbi:hypothetical protein Har1130_16990 [Haloarcula sp. CBA1130]|uniref:HalOD1 output domain-containing protein n=1 Tax=unclassified Haloarcula TaxID=2624677 RepID=UPI0012446709|nr:MULTISPECIES: HalOD1 output domain-containing protein [unclassified Haloarcula]KAA9396037.1 hypothetical protein Har1129_19250 [Haloarcula sp. CBA1129]KAA9400433.1 hypothetical protein Har1130_16990 [Haloarcula sp. CBA1130]